METRMGFFFFITMTTPNIMAMICPATVAIAAPAIPIAGSPNHQKMKIGSRIMLITAPARVETMANLGLPSARMMGFMA